MLLYYITDRKQFPGTEPERRERLLQKIEEASRSGVDYIQLREKDLTSRELEQLAREAMRRLAGSKSKLLMNSRTDIALPVGAHGVQLRSHDVSPEDVRKVWLEAGARTVPIVAVSCHTELEVMAAKQSSADFVVFGPVFEKSQQTGTGIEALSVVSRHPIPVIALGGVTVDNALSCITAGAAGIAGIRLFQENEVGEIVRALRG